MSAEFPTDAEAERLGEIVTDAVAAITGDTLALDAAAEAVPEIVRHLAPLIRARETAARAEAWDEGFSAGHEAARAVNPEWPDQPTNPYRQEADDDRD